MRKEAKRDRVRQAHRLTERLRDEIEMTGMT